jgi:hypothetical protein
MLRFLAALAILALPIAACALVDTIVPPQNTLPPTMAPLTPAEAKALQDPHFSLTDT